MISLFFPLAKIALIKEKEKVEIPIYSLYTRRETQ